MNNKEKQLLFVDICARLPYAVKCYVPIIDEIMTLTGKRLEFFCFHKDSDGLDYSHEYETVLDPLNDIMNDCIVKPYLRPMSSMTEEERCEIRKYCENNDNVKLIHDIGVSGQTYSSIIIEYLNKNMFDYRGLIKLGLGIDCTGLNIY